MVPNVAQRNEGVSPKQNMNLVLYESLENPFCRIDIWPFTIIICVFYDWYAWTRPYICGLNYLPFAIDMTGTAGKISLIIFLLFAASSCYFVTQLKFAFDFEQFFPQGDPELEFFRDFVEDNLNKINGAISFLFVCILFFSNKLQANFVTMRKSASLNFM